MLQIAIWSWPETTKKHEVVPGNCRDLLDYGRRNVLASGLRHALKQASGHARYLALQLQRHQLGQ